MLAPVSDESEDDLERGFADYESVYIRNWKAPEPYPEVIRSLVHYCAAEGALRFAEVAADAPVGYGRTFSYSVPESLGIRPGHLDEGTGLGHGQPALFLIRLALSSIMATNR